MTFSKILLFFIILSCGSFKIPFLDYDLQSLTAVTSESTGNTSIRNRIGKGLNLKVSEDTQERSLKKMHRPSGSRGGLGKPRIARSVSRTTVAPINSGMPDLTRFIVNPFRDATIRYVRLYRFWQPCYVSETLNSDNWFGSEARVEFKASLRSLQNITTASFNVTVNVDGSSSELPILLYGSFSDYPANATTRSPTDFVSLGQLPVSEINSTGTAKVSFQITEFIKRISLRPDTATLTSSQKVLIVFLVRRQCNSINSAECSFIINSDYEIPYLKVNYQRG